MRRAVCLQHVPFEGPAHFEPLLRARGYAIERVLVPSQGLPADAGDLLLVMGGPMSVNDPDPWIRQELDFIRAAVTAGTPYLGVCLGSQMLAKAMGGSVYAGARPEIGVTSVTRSPESAADPIFQPWPERFDVLEWHGEGIVLPPDSVRLAASTLFDVQAFRWGSNAYGLLFHVEADPAAVAALCRGCPGDVARSGRTADQLQADVARCLPLLREYAARIVDVLAAL